MILRFAVVILRIKPRPKAIHTYIGGILLGAMALVVMLMPMPPALLVPGNAILFFMALVVSVIALQFRMGAALLLWVVHFAVMLILGFSIFWGAEMYSYGQPLNPVAEMVTLWKFPNMPNEELNTYYEVPNLTQSKPVQWQHQVRIRFQNRGYNVLFAEDATTGAFVI